MQNGAGSNAHVSPRGEQDDTTFTIDLSGCSSVEISAQKLIHRLDERARRQKQVKRELEELWRQVDAIKATENKEETKVEQVQEELRSLEERGKKLRRQVASFLEVDPATGIEAEDVPIEASVWDAALFLGLYTRIWETVLGVILFLANMIMQILLCISIVELGRQRNRVLSDASLEGLLLWRLTVGHLASNYDEQTQSSLTSRVCHDYLGRTSSNLHANSVAAFNKYLGTFVYDHLIPFVEPEFGLVLCFLVLLLWALVVTAEFIDIHKYIYALMTLPRAAHTAIKVHDDGHYTFSQISYGRIVLVWLGVILPRILVAFILAYFGCLFLVETASIEDLIVNAVALGFVFDLDELFYRLLPASYQHIVSNTAALPIKDTLIPDNWCHSAAVSCSKVKGLREIVGFIATLVFVLILYAVELEPAVAVMREGKAILCDGNQNFIYVRNLATGVVYYSETTTGEELFDSYSLLMRTQRYTGANAENWMPMHISSALQLVDYDVETIPTIQDLSDRTWAFQGLTLSSQVALWELGEKRKETELLAKANLQCVDWDEDEPQRVALFSQIVLEKNPDFRTSTAKCRDVRDWCEEESVRQVCPITCQCTELRTGRFDYAGCPEACGELLVDEYQKFEQSVRPVFAADCFDSPIAETGLSYTRGVPVDWWNTFFQELQRYFEETNRITLLHQGVYQWTVEAAQGVQRVSNNAFGLNMEVEVNLVAWAGHQGYVDPSVPEEEKIIRSPCVLVPYLVLFFEIQLCNLELFGYGTIAALCPVMCQLCTPTQVARSESITIDTDTWTFYTAYDHSVEHLGVQTLRRSRPEIVPLLCGFTYTQNTVGTTNYGFLEGGDAFFSIEARWNVWYTLDLCGSSISTVLRLFQGDFAAEIYSEPNLTLFESRGNCLGAVGTAVTFKLNGLLDSSLGPERVQLLVMVDSHEEGIFSMDYQCWRVTEDIPPWSGSCEGVDGGADGSGTCIQSIGFRESRMRADPCSMRIFPTNILAIQNPSRHVHDLADADESSTRWYPEFVFTGAGGLSVGGRSITGTSAHLQPLKDFIDVDWALGPDAVASNESSLLGWKYCLRDLDNQPWWLTSGSCLTSTFSSIDNGNRSVEVCISHSTFPAEYEALEGCHFNTNPSWPPSPIRIDRFSTETEYDYVVLDGFGTGYLFSGDGEIDQELGQLNLSSLLGQGYWPSSIDWTSDQFIERTGWRLCTPLL